MTILDAMRDRQVFGEWFASASWDAWRAFLSVLFGLPLDDEARAVYRKHTGRDADPAGAFSEAWVIAGRRGGKSIIAALVAVFLGCFKDYSRYLKPGEVGTVAVIAADRKQARTIIRYVKGFLQIPLLRSLVAGETAESIELQSGIVIEVHTCSYRSVRGYTLLAAVCDETAFWRSADDATNPDTEILAALRPGLATIPGALLLCISSPYSRRGALWAAYSRHFGKAGPVLVWQAASREMNPSLPQSVVDQAMQEDESAARAEYLAEFRSDLESFIDSELVRSLVVPGRRELAPLAGLKYFGFADPSGGSGRDSYTAAVAHKEKDGRLVVDCVREKRPPFSPEQTTAEFAAMFLSYGVRRIRGDRFAGSWPAEQFQKHGVTYEAAGKSKSEIYKDTLPLFNSGKVEMLDIPKLIGQLCGLERRVARGGHDSIDHGPNQHDDLINSASGVLWMLSQRSQARSWLTGLPVDDPRQAEAVAKRLNPKPGPRAVSVGNTVIWRQ